MYAKAKGTPIEQRIQGQSMAELTGARMYRALAEAASAHGLDEVHDLFMEVAGEHAAMASFYAQFVGRYPYEDQDFWQFVKGLSKAEECGETAINALAKQVEEAGFPEAAEKVATFAAQHKHHAEVTQQMLEKYAPASVKENTKKRYVCGICGFVYEGDLESEPEDFTCPLCEMPKDVFQLQEDV